MKIQVLSLFLLIFIVSCQTKNNQAENSTNELSSYKLEIVDSLTVQNILARVFMFQTADKDHVIFRDGASSDVYLFDRDGNLIDKWDKTGDVPGAFSMSAGNFARDKAGNLVILDIMNGLKVLKKNGDIVKNFGIYQNQYSLGGAFSLFKTYEVIQKDGKEYLLYSLDVIEEPRGDYSSEFLQTRKNLLLTNLETEETQTFLPFPEGSQFLNGNVYYFSDFRPVFSYDEKSQVLYLAFQNEPILYTYDWSGTEPVLKERTALNLDGFLTGIGYEKGAVDFAKIADYKINPYPSQILNIEKHEKDLLITFKPTPADKSDIALVAAGEASKELKAKLSEEVKKRTVVLTQAGDIIPLILPEMNSYDFAVIGEDIWWMKKHTGEEEQEDFTVYRGRLLK
ncbi:hypothetical protein LV84_00435 [Algoriphagus ratkowskyi]|uniref:6-bladed beta-propeller protein n=1 Tax=Algoriphagus ratkowskyi TaxID=57028 RepID=A0A2W7SBC5_9BACT|nr:hypothetical protein [Algoriphagus ratkowskyi]PZX60165.1 hypothetical protein LV84_00435 [Algoriphagus ratkowskyi]TXD77991.1 hypothetical protein ESW18_08045 [Algoriphagus ratkowskyi]